MQEKIDIVLEEALHTEISTPESLEQFILKFLSKKGLLTDLFSALKDILPEQRKEVGARLNTLKAKIEEKFKASQESISLLNGQQTQHAPIDLTLPVIPDTLGSLHPLTIIRNRIIEIFERIGFNLSEGPEIEDDWHNFTALNFPPNHPAREMQDTFFVDKDPDIALRTHTSSVQIRTMESQKPPIRTLSIGRVYRNEAISARAHCFFHQVEGLFVAPTVSFRDLKQTLYYFAKEMFGKETQVRFRPSFFPFTEPSAEIDISCGLHNPKGCDLCGGSKNICKGSGWVEIGGSGMVHPNVLKNCGIDPEEYTGFAFGMGIERITMLKYQIKDLRLFSENDVRFLKQFKHLS